MNNGNERGVERPNSAGPDLTAMLEVLAEPVAWMTYDIHGAQMVWTDYEEACLYCDDDEQPIPLYMPSNADSELADKM